MKVNAPSYLWFALATTNCCPSSVWAQASIQPCLDGEDPCVKSFVDSCNQLILDHDFSGCCSMSDNSITGGCNVTTAPGRSCTLDGRTSSCDIVVHERSQAIGSSCLGAYQFTLKSRSEEEGECPPSDYQPRDTNSIAETLFPLQMVLSGVSDSLSYKQARLWQSLTEAHTQATFAETNNDVDGYIALLSEDTFPIEPDENGDLTMVYLQQVVWRSPENDESLAAKSFLDEAFGDTANNAEYLEMLQESFPLVTAVSGVTLVTEAATAEVTGDVDAAIQTGIETASSETDNPQCNICGEGNVITKPNGDVVFGDGNVVSDCSEAQTFGNSGSINPELCAALPDRVMFSCGCAKEGVSSSIAGMPGNVVLSLALVTTTGLYFEL